MFWNSSFHVCRAGDTERRIIMVWIETTVYRPEHRASGKTISLTTHLWECQSPKCYWMWSRNSSRGQSSWWFVAQCKGWERHLARGAWSAKGSASWISSTAAATRSTRMMTTASSRGACRQSSRRLATPCRWRSHGSCRCRDPGPQRPSGLRARHKCRQSRSLEKGGKFLFRTGYCCETKMEEPPKL